MGRRAALELLAGLRAQLTVGGRCLARGVAVEVDETAVERLGRVCVLCQDHVLLAQRRRAQQLVDVREQDRVHVEGQNVGAFLEELPRDPPARRPQHVHVVQIIVHAVLRLPLLPAGVRFGVRRVGARECLLSEALHHRLPILLQRVASTLLIPQDEPVLVSTLAHLIHPVASPPNHLVVGREHNDLFLVATALHHVPCHPWRCHINHTCERTQLANAPIAIRRGYSGCGSCLVHCRLDLLCRGYGGRGRCIVHCCLVLLCRWRRHGQAERQRPITLRCHPNLLRRVLSRVLPPAGGAEDDADEHAAGKGPAAHVRQSDTYERGPPLCLPRRRRRAWAVRRMSVDSSEPFFFFRTAQVDALSHIVLLKSGDFGKFIFERLHVHVARAKSDCPPGGPGGRRLSLHAHAKWQSGQGKWVSGLYVNHTSFHTSYNLKPTRDMTLLSTVAM